MKKYMIIGIAFLTAGCELVVDVDIPLEKPTLTLNSFMIQDSVWTARLALSRHILDDAPYGPVTDGFVVIYHQSEPLDTLTGDGAGGYTGDSMPVLGETYEIRAASATYGSVRSTSYTPPPVEIESLEVEKKDAGDDFSEASIRLRMKDRAGEKNFYQVLLMGKYKYRDFRTGQERIALRQLHISSKDPAIDNENVDSYEGVFFKDVLFEGKEITLLLESYYGDFESAQEIIFYLRTLSEDYYRYKTTALLQNENSGNPFAQPVGVYNNIENGFGIFAGFSQSAFVYKE
jgi:hypothetical protein